MKKKNELLFTNNEWTFDKIELVLEHVERIAKEKYNIDYYPLSVEIISSDQMLDAYSSHAMPVFYQHWSIGKRNLIDATNYKKGNMGLAFEVISNTAPSIAYLMENNSMAMQTLVLAHCIGHSCYFKTNYLFKQWTQADFIVDYLKFAKEFINNCEEKYGFEAVEKTIDAAHALQYASFDKYKRKKKTRKEKSQKIKDRIDFEEKSYNDLWKILDNHKASSSVTDITKDEVLQQINKRFVPEPEENILYFLEKKSPVLQEWQREILRIVRKISEYFYPQFQTQVINEGCLVAGSLIDTDHGLLPIEKIVNEKLRVKAWDGEEYREIYDWFIHHNKARTRIVTNYGFEIHGGEDHKIFTGGHWTKISDLSIGQNLELCLGNDQWPTDEININYTFDNHKTMSIRDIEKISNMTMGYYNSVTSGRHSLNPNRIEQFNEFSDLYLKNSKGNFATKEKYPCTFPETVNEDLAYFLGYLIGDGNVSRKNRTVGITSGDKCVIDNVKRIVEHLFSVNTRIYRDGNRYRLQMSKLSLIDFLQSEFQIKDGKSSHIKEVPLKILASPKHVVSAFLRGLFDADGHAGKSGVIYCSNSEVLSSQVQQLLLKFGIASSKKTAKPKKKSESESYRACFYTRIFTTYEKKFAEEIGFNITRKQNTLLENIKNIKRIKRSHNLIVTDVISDVGTTYDFSVKETHRYKSSAFIHHNCATFTHYNIMNDLYDEGLVSEGTMIEFLSSHAGVILQTLPDFRSEAQKRLDRMKGKPEPYRYSGINPYALGFAIFQDIRRMCENPTEEDKQYFPDIVGKDWKDLIYNEIIPNYRDESFIRQFLSPKVIRDFKFFALRNDENNSESREILEVHNESGYRNIKKILAETKDMESKFPNIQVTGVDITGDRTLTLTHYCRKDQLLTTEAQDVLAHIKELWGYTVDLVSVNDQGNVVEKFSTDKWRTKI